MTRFMDQSVIGNANRKHALAHYPDSRERLGSLAEEFKSAPPGGNEGTTGKVVMPSFSNAFMINVCELASLPKNPVVCCHSRSREM